MLTERQISLLVILKSSSDWVTSDRLSEELDTNKKTIQNDIKQIVMTLESKIKIESNRRKGYFLAYLDENESKLIANNIFQDEIYSSMDYNASIIITYLFFQTEFVSMQKIADLFYLSKRSVSDAIRIIQRWVSRNRNLEVIISHQYGVKIDGAEETKIIFLSLASTIKILENSKLPRSVVDAFKKNHKIIYRILLNSLKKHDFIIPGDDFEIFVRFVSFLILRRNIINNYQSLNYESITSPIISELIKNIYQQMDIQLSIGQKKLINERFLEFAPLISKDGFKYIDQLRNFEKDIINFLNLPTNSLFDQNNQIFSHIERMMKRIQLGHGLMNHYAYQVIEKYTLEMYLCRKFFPKNFGMQPRLAELAYVVVYLAQSMKKYKDKIKICLVSNRSFTTIQALKNQLNSSFNGRIGRIDILPLYLYREGGTSIDYDIYLTTEEAVIFMDDKYLFIGNSSSSEDNLSVIEEMKNLLKKEFENKKQRIIDLYYPSENTLKINKRIQSISDLFPTRGGLVNFPLNNSTFLFCSINEELPTKLVRYNLRIPIVIKQRRVKNIFYINFKQNKDYMDTMIFFEVVSTIIRNNK